MPIDLRDQYFGTEIEMTGITRERAAQVVAEMQITCNLIT